MKAKDLIEALGKVDPDSEVYRDEDQTVCTPVQIVAFERVRHNKGIGRRSYQTDEWIVILQ